MKALFRFKYEALLAARAAGAYTYESTAEAGDLEAQEPGLTAAGEVSCLRSSGGDVFAWREKSPSIYYGVSEEGDPFVFERGSDCVYIDTAPTLDRSKLAKVYCDDEIIEVNDDDPAYLELIKYLD